MEEDERNKLRGAISYLMQNHEQYMPDYFENQELSQIWLLGFLSGLEQTLKIFEDKK